MAPPVSYISAQQLADKLKGYHIRSRHATAPQHVQGVAFAAQGKQNLGGAGCKRQCERTCLVSARLGGCHNRNKAINKQRLYMQDFAGGHIKGCKNITVDAFEDDDDVDSIIDKQLKGKEQVVVHCALSQQRGPFAARR